jgi:hypothetical protein
MLGWGVLEITQLPVTTYILSTCTHPFVIIASKVSEGSSGSEGVKREHMTLTLMKK